MESPAHDDSGHRQASDRQTEDYETLYLPASVHRPLPIHWDHGSDQYDDWGEGLGQVILSEGGVSTIYYMGL